LLIFVIFSLNCSKGSSFIVGQPDIQISQADNNTFIRQNSFQPESLDLNLIQKNTIVGYGLPVTANPQVLGMILGTEGSTANKDINEYEVLAGDSLGGIAEKFGISLETLLWANNLSRSSAIKVGQKLVTLPVSGVLHYVKAGDTVSEIALKYKAAAQDIVDFNELTSQNDIFVGDILIVPGGKMPAVSAPSYASSQVPLASSYFICPIASPCRITQGLHFYNAVDFSHGKCGDYIYAAAGGTVQRVKYGWNSGAGNTIYIQHPNGVVTSYGHILSALVNPGDQVYQGQPIAIMGGNRATQGNGAGISTGCHVHFAVHGAKNPFTK
jgi:LysM repeat protein